jgi:predicted phage terminase large subunit-like protein
LVTARYLTETVLNNPYIPQKPTPKQAEFLLLLDLEALYGGAAGGGKSSALLMGGLQFVQMPDYSAIIFRRNYTDMLLRDAVMDRAKAWLINKDCRWSADAHTWRFPSGASLAFGFLDNPNDKYRYQSAAFQYIGWDEVTQFEENDYLFMYSRLRKPKDSPIPLRMRAASNPGGRGHMWVRDRFINPETRKAAFIPALLDDNPYIDKASYEESLNRLDAVTRRQYRYGDWDVQASGNMFRRESWKLVEDYPRNGMTIRAWDFAGTESTGKNDPDWTVGTKMCMLGGRYWILDVVRARLSPAGVENLIRNTAHMDGYGVEIWLEQEPADAGLTVVQHYAREVLSGYSCFYERAKDSKTERAKGFSAAVENGNVSLLEGRWRREFVDELALFPTDGVHDDQEDSASLAFRKLSEYVNSSVVR